MSRFMNETISDLRGGRESWRVLITIFGWLCAIGGALRLFGPLFVVTAGHALLKQPYFTTVAAAIWVVLGLLFCFFGYRH